MADTIDGPLFVEFYGLPGCGKSTISHFVAQRLSNEGFTIAEPSYLYDHQAPLRRKVFKFLLGVFFLFSQCKLYNRVNAIVKKNGYRGLERFSQIVNVLNKVDVYRRPHSNGVILWDQGLIQACVSLSTNGIINASENVSNLFKFVPTDVIIIGVFIDVSEELALERMGMRKTNDSRVEKLKDDREKKIMLSKIREDISEARNAFLEIGEEFRPKSLDSLDKLTDEVYHFVKNQLIINTTREIII